MVVGKITILISYLVMAIKLIFFSIPSVVSMISTLHARGKARLDDTNSSLRKNKTFLKAGKRLVCTFCTLLY